MKQHPNLALKVTTFLLLALAALATACGESVSNSSMNANKSSSLKSPTPTVMNIDQKLRRTFTEWCYPDDNEGELRHGYEASTKLEEIYSKETNDFKYFETKGVPNLVESIKKVFAPCDQLAAITDDKFRKDGDIQTVENLQDRLISCT